MARRKNELNSVIRIELICLYFLHDPWRGGAIPLVVLILMSPDPDRDQPPGLSEPERDRAVMDSDAVTEAA
jgi:hypothetical protein